MNLFGRCVSIEGLLFAYCTTGMMEESSQNPFLFFSLLGGWGEGGCFLFLFLF